MAYEALDTNKQMQQANKQTNAKKEEEKNYQTQQTYSVMSDGLSVWQMSLSLVSTSHEMSEIIRKPAAIIMAETWQKYICLLGYLWQ